MGNFDELSEIKTELVEGIDKWHWVKGDTGSWDGPKQDWEKEHRTKYFAKIKDYRTIITAGGNNGMYTRFYADKFKLVAVFEPAGLNFHNLVLNNQFDNVVKFNCALGKEITFKQLNRPTMTNTGMQSVNEAPGLMPVYTIDMFQFPDVDMIQLDVEGYEYNVLLGAKETIEKYKPVVICENGGKSEIVDFLKQFGYDKVEQSVSDTVYAVV